MNKKSKVLITGTGGMVGKILSEELERDGFENLVLINRNNLDLMDREKTIEFFKEQKPKYVFHVAARVGGIKDNITKPVEFLRDNLLINVNVIDATFICKAKKMINISSATIYTNRINTPSEKDLFKGKIEEGNEAYAISKIAGLKLCEYYNREYNTNFITLVAPNIYGEYSKFDPDKSNVVAALIVRFYEAKNNNFNNVEVWGSGNAEREFLYVKDLANIMIESMKNMNKEDAFYGILNCGLEQEISIRELAMTIKEIIGFKGDIFFDKTKPEGVKRRSLNSSKIKGMLKNIKHTSFGDGLKNTYDYYLKNEKNINY